MGKSKNVLQKARKEYFKSLESKNETKNEELIEEDSARDTQDLEAEEVLRVEGVSRSGVLDNISFTLHQGEILGIAGLAGAGRTELARAIIGADKIDDGTVYLEGSPLKPRSPQDSVKHGIAILPEDRKAQGIFPGFSVTRSISAGALWKISFMTM